ncbi:hypothetical protein sphantq_04411 (plasmid) [Sphingobium sp. AntQ-1]|nr:hypothetical protein sphantq_04411 [Sphingobium sp. AntQ-1]
MVLSGAFWDIMRACRRFRRIGLQIKTATSQLGAAARGGNVADTIAYQVDDRGLCRHAGVAARATVALPAPSERRLCISAAWQLCAPDQSGCTDRSLLLPTGAHNIQPAPRFSRRSAARFACRDRSHRWDSRVGAKHGSRRRRSTRHGYFPSRRGALASPPRCRGAQIRCRRQSNGAPVGEAGLAGERRSGPCDAPPSPFPAAVALYSGTYPATITISA